MVSTMYIWLLQKVMGSTFTRVLKYTRRDAFGQKNNFAKRQFYLKKFVNRGSLLQESNNKKKNFNKNINW